MYGQADKECVSVSLKDTLVEDLADASKTACMGRQKVNSGGFSKSAVGTSSV